MTLWEMWSNIEFVCNKDFAGGIITPQRFGELIALANIDHFRSKYGLPEEYKPGSPIPEEYNDITRKNTDDLKALKVRLSNISVVNGIIGYPSNYVHLESIVYNYTKTIAGVATVLPRSVEILRELEFAARDGNFTKRPTLQNPCGIIRSDGIHIKPLTISSCDFNYYKFPRTPIFNYTEGDGFITYNASTSIELEWPEDEKIVIMRRCLEYIGVNLRDGDVVNYANTKLKTG